MAEQVVLFEHSSPITKLLECRRQRFEVEEALQWEMDDFDRRVETFKRREDSLRIRDNELQESLIRFNKVLTENELKRQKALKRIFDEKSAIEKKESEITAFTAVLDVKRTIHEELCRKTDDIKQYKEYLDNVVKSSPDNFSDIGDILNRYRLLQDASLFLTKKKQVDEFAADQGMLKLLSLQKQREIDSLNRSNDIANLQQDLEGHQVEASKLSSEYDAVLTMQAEKMVETSEVVRSISQIHSRCQASKSRYHRVSAGGNATSSSGRRGSSDMLEDLEFIESTMHDLKEILSEYSNNNINETRLVS